MILLLLACQPDPVYPWAYVHPEYNAITGSQAPLYPYQLFKPEDVLPNGPACVEVRVDKDKDVQHIDRVWVRWAPGVYGYGDLDFVIPKDWISTPICEPHISAESFAYVNYLHTLHGDQSPYEAERQAAKARGPHWSHIVDTSAAMADIQAREVQRAEAALQAEEEPK